MMKLIKKRKKNGNYLKKIIYFILNDFKLAEEEEKINVKFLLIYNNIQNSTNNNLIKLLIS